MYWKNPAQIALVIIFISVVIYSCDDTLVQSDIDGRIIPDNQVSFSEHIQPVLNLKCAFSGCHDDQTRAANLSITTWANVVSDPSIVFPYYPQNSRLAWAIEGTGSTLMPPYGYPALTQNQIDGIKTWIAEGATNN
ncbi:MAG: hypothetical protein A2V66_13610 [Ignavibacteria bacterium RBG_13_36_8]|nr:MAG: hypothetical protein A2V66_13610 [Ignavibacteria bacterium RBG_13_36_8]